MDGRVMTEEGAEHPKVFSPAYYDRLYEIEDRHWWSVGMREIEGAVLRAHLPGGPLDVLDAGCGTGVMLDWLATFAGDRPVRGVDLAPEAIEYCRRRGHGLARLGSVTDLPYDDRSFDLVHSGDVLQHLPVRGGPERAVAESWRVLRPGGHLFVRTNARPRGGGPAGPDYQRFDRARLCHLVEGGGFIVLLASYVNCAPSLATELREWLHPPPGRPAGQAQDTGLRIRLDERERGWRSALLLRMLRGEGWMLARLGIRLPFGHTLVCLARRPISSR
jgi:SAM-dependent methyltransferase